MDDGAEAERQVRHDVHARDDFEHRQLRYWGQRMMEELTVEDRLNDEVREILTQRQDEMRRTGVSYQEMYKKVKGQLARDRKLVLR